MTPAKAAREPRVDVEIPLPGDFDVEWTLRFLGARHAPSLEAVSGTEYTRSVAVDGKPMTMALRFASRPLGGWRLFVRSAPDVPPATLVSLVTAMFDLDADLVAFRRRIRRDRVLGPLVARRPGIRLPRFLDPFEGAARAVLGQQVSVAAARRIVDRLVESVGRRAPDLEGRSFRVFPSPWLVLAAGAEKLGQAGLTRAKQRALLSIAGEMRSGTLDWKTLRQGPSAAAQARLEQIPGVGPWTAAYLRMRVLGDRDAFPATDLGVVKALVALNGNRPLTTDAILAASEGWRPWRAYATLHLWQSLA